MKNKQFDKLVAMARELKLDFDKCTKVDQVCPAILQDWDGPPEAAHQFVILLKKNKQERGYPEEDERKERHTGGLLS